MAASAENYIARGMGAEQASELADQVEGTPSAVRLIGLGFAVPLANELVAQIGATTGNIGNLMALGVPPDLASMITTDIDAL